MRISFKQPLVVESNLRQENWCHQNLHHCRFYCYCSLYCHTCMLSLLIVSHCSLTVIVSVMSLLSVLLWFLVLSLLSLLSQLHNDITLLYHHCSLDSVISLLPTVFCHCSLLSLPLYCHCTLCAAHYHGFHRNASRFEHTVFSNLIHLKTWLQLLTGMQA